MSDHRKRSAGRELWYAGGRKEQGDNDENLESFSIQMTRGEAGVTGVEG